jgi:hypothetical protein
MRIFPLPLSWLRNNIFGHKRTSNDGRTNSGLPKVAGQVLP